MNFNDEILNKYLDFFKKHDAYLVGGYLRNFIIDNVISNDRDIVVVGNAKQIAFEFSQISSGKFIELDSENDIYRVVLQDKINYFDISKALFDDIEKDAHRRDFTINAIFYNFKNDSLYDPLNGVDDIKNKIIKTSDLKNLHDDPLRILRLFRFLAHYNFQIEDKLLEYSFSNFDKIFLCAKERLNQEILKMFEGKYIADTLLKMYETGVLEILFPFVKDVKRVPSNSHHHLDLIHHLIETVRNIRVNNPCLKIAAFLHDIAKPACWTIEPDGRHRFIGHDIKGEELSKIELKKLNFSNKQIQYISTLVKSHIYPSALAFSDTRQKAFARFIRKMGDLTPDVIELARADRLSALGEVVTDEMVKNNLSHLQKLLDYYNQVKSIIKSPKKLLNGNEIIEILNIKPSKTVGLISALLLEKQLEGSITSKQDAIEFVKKYKIKPLK